MIQVGDQIPDAAVTVAGQDGHENVNAQSLFSGKKVVMFAVPGAFTPTCSESHLPGYVVAADQFKAKGVDSIVCLSVNDAFVMSAWGASQNADNITMLADGGGALTKAMGMEMETADFGGTRSQRYAMVVDNGVVSLLNVEPPQTFEGSKAEVILAAL
ncbi:MAG: Antioxidant, AhpC/Tsa family [uncultured Thiotrichaceae bacterium]|uniref:Glutathione-dependent peroxiredoxin n=1 Tax=uncultured Thiotrichaceae bacterium TaxID=298394 RepID=A0A6S6T012_9GAMM|nr:MAG: Antioxidant, AhpC/Tsa family [uncultured Thiotrichaceae bacterium]